MHEKFERAIVENPDDLAGYSAYADWLQKQGDPRGEFITVQLALEDESQPKEARDALKVREAELLAAHEREWLGDLASHILDRPWINSSHPDFDWDRFPPDYDWNQHDWTARPKIEHRWRRGFLAELQLQCLTIALARAIADAPVLRLLQKLHIVGTAAYYGMQENAPAPRIPPPPKCRDYFEWLELLGAPFLQSLRVFQMGDRDGEPPEERWNDNHTYAPGIERVIAEMTRIEELHLLCKEYESSALFALPNLTHLRVLRMYALGEPYSERDQYEIHLDVLAQNPALVNLTHLYLHPHYANNRCFIPLGRIAPLLRSPHLKKLTHLTLRLSDMGDDGVREIVDSGILKQLRKLDLRHGAITDVGARLFARCKDAKRLERLDLSRNAVSALGLAALRKAKINAVADRPLAQAELDERQYLREGDFE